MATQESWINDTLILVEWFEPLTTQELRTCFQNLTNLIREREQSIDVIFDITGSGHIPVEAPMLAIRSRFLAFPQICNVVVVGMDQWAQILARVASRTTGKAIIFYRTYDEAAKAISWIEARAS